MKFLVNLLSLFILLSGFLGIITIVFIKSLSAPGPLRADKTVVIERGLGAGRIASKLKDENVIASPIIFKSAFKVFGEESLKAGEYRFEEKISLLATLEKLELGDVIQRQITIPEGLTSYEIVELLNANASLSGQIKDIPDEGSLLPETYSYSLGDNRNDKLARMQSSMEDTLNILWETRDNDLPIETKEEALILASIVEKETGIAEERKKVAGVFINRLRKNMPLQTDPTVIYAMTKGKHQNDGKGPLGRRLLKKDLEIDSPYNTYKYPGLPPGPIANPGRDAIAAALNPAQHDYIYFVADGSGGHIFAKTLAEHNYNAANWRKIRKEKEKKAINKKVIEDEISGPLFK